MKNRSIRPAESLDRDFAALPDLAPVDCGARIKPVREDEDDASERRFRVRARSTFDAIWRGEDIQE